MWYIILGVFLFISALFAILFWFALIVAKRSDKRNELDFTELESKDTKL